MQMNRTHFFVFKEGFFRKFFSYVWLVFKSGYYDMLTVLMYITKMALAPFYIKIGLVFFKCWHKNAMKKKVHPPVPHFCNPIIVPITGWLILQRLFHFHAILDLFESSFPLIWKKNNKKYWIHFSNVFVPEFGKIHMLKMA